MWVGGMKVAVGSGVTVGVGSAVAVGIFVIAKLIRASTVASMSGVATGIVVGSAAATAASTVPWISGSAVVVQPRPTNKAAITNAMNLNTVRLYSNNRQFGKNQLVIKIHSPERMKYREQLVYFYLTAERICILEPHHRG